MRALIDIPDEQVAALAAIARRRGSSRSALVRAAIGEFVAKERQAPLDESFGLWRGGEDGLALQRRLRGEW